uniref:Uncharacterized protein n=1 Tax=viral metagenome TaxID=1070528 RepID=A0A6C0CLB6_9ZZZZ
MTYFLFTKMVYFILTNFPKDIWNKNTCNYILDFLWRNQLNL